MKKASKAKKATPIRALVITLVAVVALLVGGITLANAASGDTPAHSKTLTANPDGTYTIALNVTGDSERKVQKVNVIVIVDRSGSMGESSGNTSVTYTPTNSTGGWWTKTTSMASWTGSAYSWSAVAAAITGIPIPSGTTAHNTLASGIGGSPQTSRASMPRKRP